MEYTKKNVAAMIDHTLLKPQAEPSQIRRLCEEAITWGFASVCVNPCYVNLCAGLLADSPVRVCTVIGFPLGAAATAVKAFETEDAVRNGADEIDMVINIGMIKAGDRAYVENDIRRVVEAADGRLVKVIIEACLLTDEEKVLACQASKAAGADFVKTSTGFSTGGAVPRDVALMRRTVGPDMGVKAAGGIHSAAEAIACLEAGANRLGVSAGIAVVSELD